MESAISSRPPPYSSNWANAVEAALRTAATSRNPNKQLFDQLALDKAMSQLSTFAPNHLHKPYAYNPAKPNAKEIDGAEGMMVDAELGAIQADVRASEAYAARAWKELDDEVETRRVLPPSSYSQHLRPKSSVHAQISASTPSQARSSSVAPIESGTSSSSHHGHRSARSLPADMPTHRATPISSSPLPHAHALLGGEHADNSAVAVADMDVDGGGDADDENESHNNDVDLEHEESPSAREAQLEKIWRLEEEMEVINRRRLLAAQLFQQETQMHAMALAKKLAVRRAREAELAEASRRVEERRRRESKEVEVAAALNHDPSHGAPTNAISSSGEDIPAASHPVASPLHPDALGTPAPRHTAGKSSLAVPHDEKKKNDDLSEEEIAQLRRRMLGIGTGTGTGTGAGVGAGAGYKQQISNPFDELEDIDNATRQYVEGLRAEPHSPAPMSSRVDVATPSIHEYSYRSAPAALPSPPPPPPHSPFAAVAALPFSSSSSSLASAAPSSFQQAAATPASSHNHHHNVSTSLLFASSPSFGSHVPPLTPRTAAMGKGSRASYDEDEPQTATARTGSSGNMVASPRTMLASSTATLPSTSRSFYDEIDTDLHRVPAGYSMFGSPAAADPAGAFSPASTSRFHPTSAAATTATSMVRGASSASVASADGPVLFLRYDHSSLLHQLSAEERRWNEQQARKRMDAEMKLREDKEWEERKRTSQRREKEEATSNERKQFHNQLQSQLDVERARIDELLRQSARRASIQTERRKAETTRVREEVSQRRLEDEVALERASRKMEEEKERYRAENRVREQAALAASQVALAEALIMQRQAQYEIEMEDRRMQQAMLTQRHPSIQTHDTHLATDPARNERTQHHHHRHDDVKHDPPLSAFHAEVKKTPDRPIAMRPKHSAVAVITSIKPSPSSSMMPAPSSSFTFTSPPPMDEAEEWEVITSKLSKLLPPGRLYDLMQAAEKDELAAKQSLSVALGIGTSSLQSQSTSVPQLATASTATTKPATNSFSGASSTPRRSSPLLASTSVRAPVPVRDPSPERLQSSSFTLPTHSSSPPPYTTRDRQRHSTAEVDDAGDNDDDAASASGVYEKHNVKSSIDTMQPAQLPQPHSDSEEKQKWQSEAFKPAITTSPAMLTEEDRRNREAALDAALQHHQKQLGELTRRKISLGTSTSTSFSASALTPLSSRMESTQPSTQPDARSANANVSPPPKPAYLDTSGSASSSTLDSSSALAEKQNGYQMNHQEAGGNLAESNNLTTDDTGGSSHAAVQLQSTMGQSLHQGEEDQEDDEEDDDDDDDELDVGVHVSSHIGARSKVTSSSGHPSASRQVRSNVLRRAIGEEVDDDDGDVDAAVEPSVAARMHPVQNSATSATAGDDDDEFDF